MRIGCLLVGQDPYSDEGDYLPTYMDEDNYPFRIAAFIPTFKEANNPVKVITYIRIINLLQKDTKKWDEREKEILFKKAGQKLVEHYKDKGIYFCNKDDLEQEDIKKGLINEKWEIDKNTIFIFFGSEAIKVSKRLIKKDIIKSEQVLRLPHPSKNNTDKFWKEYDFDTNFTQHSSQIEIQKVINAVQKLT